MKTILKRFKRLYEDNTKVGLREIDSKTFTRLVWFRI
jgi:hypothetical protein